LHPAGHPDRFFQLAANEVEQGQVDAYVASQLLGAKTAFVLENTRMAYAGDQGNYEEGNPDGELAQSFITAFTSIPGHTLVAPPMSTCLVACTGSLAAAILAKHPDLVFYAGSAYDGGAELKRVLVAAGYTRPLLGGDVIANDPAWLSEAQGGAGSTFATIALPDVSSLTSPRARAFVSAYETFAAGKPDNALSPVSVMAYDAANALIAALTRAIEQGAGRSLVALRSQTGADLASARFGYSGITGAIAFDEQGNNAGERIFSVYVVSGSAESAPQWALFRVVQCSGSEAPTCQEVPRL
jgi:ABC-type branched-subunit amino acid transport system substrate-binding protein